MSASADETSEEEDSEGYDNEEAYFYPPLDVLPPLNPPIKVTYDEGLYDLDTGNHRLFADDTTESWYG